MHAFYTIERCISTVKIRITICKISNLFLVDDDVSIDKDVIEEEELSRFGLLATEFRQHPLSYQHSPCYCQWLPHNHLHSH